MFDFLAYEHAKAITSDRQREAERARFARLARKVRRSKAS